MTSIKLLRETDEPFIKKGTSIIPGPKGFILASRSSSDPDFYLFDNSPIGVRNMALKGTFEQIIDFLYRERNRGIKNKIEEAQTIYYSLATYVPKERIKGLYPLEDVVTSLTKAMLDYVPGTTLSDITSNIATFFATLKELKDKKPSAVKDTKELYLRFSYLIEDHVKPLGKKIVYFESVLALLLGIKESPV